MFDDLLCLQRGSEALLRFAYAHTYSQHTKCKSSIVNIGAGGCDLIRLSVPNRYA
jgi:hypothetical protein